MRLSAVFTVFLAAAGALAAQTPRAAGNAFHIVRPMVSQSEDGPSLERGEAFQPGEQAFFSFQVQNYKIADNGKVQLTAHIQVMDSRGTPIAPVDDEVIGTSVRDEDKSWQPKFRAQIQIPPIGPPGPYRIEFEVGDLQSGQTAADQIAFPVRGREVAPSPTLVVRNLGLYRSQDDAAPLKIAAYRAGDILWVRFDMTGYRHGEQNAIDVTYDVAVVRSDGSELFSQPDAAVEKSQAFYPQPWIPAEFNLSLQSTMNTGAYTLVITAHDAIGHQTATAKADFKVE